MRATARLICLAAILALGAQAEQPRVERSVVFGMYSGLALLMDVYHPVEPNGYGVVLIAGSGWHQPLGYDAKRIAVGGIVRTYGKALVDAGYTVFVINHRMAPRFRYPAALEDAQRAVRFIRHHAADYGISAGRIGGVGGSSGGHLIALLGTLDGAGDPDDPDPVNRESAKLQCVVVRAAPSDLMRMNSPFGAMTVASFLGMRLPRHPSKDSIEYRTYRDASPIYHVSADDPPFLLIHGDRDETVPFEMATRMRDALRAAGVPVKLCTMHGAGHGVPASELAKIPDYRNEVVEWMNRYLRR